MLTPQPSPRQLWVAFRDRAWHFDWDEAKASWMDDRGQGVELYGLHRDHDQPRSAASRCACRGPERPGPAQLADQVGQPAAVDEELPRPARERAGAAAEEQAGEDARVAAADGGGAAVDETVAGDVDAARAGGGREARAVARAVVVGERPVAGRDLGGGLGAGLGPVGEGEAAAARLFEGDDAGQGERRRAAPSRRSASASSAAVSSRARSSRA